MFSAQTSCWSITVVRTDKSYCARLPRVWGQTYRRKKKKRNFPKTIISIYFLSQLHLHLRSQWVEPKTIVKDCEFTAINLKVFGWHGHNADQCTVGVMTPQNILT